MSHDAYVHPNPHHVAFEPTIGMAWGYGPLVNEIKQKTGIEFELWHTGGNCWLLTGVAETGHVINIGDNDGPLEPLYDHHKWAREKTVLESMCGWTVIVYENEEKASYGEDLLMLSTHDADERELVLSVIAILQELPHMGGAADL